jgi:membrane-bound serine protease (ClpP class)
MRIRLATAVGITLPFTIITVFLLSLILRARASKVVTGASGLVDMAALAHTALNPAGKVFVDGEFWDAVSSRPVEAGARVKVIAVEGLVLKVEPE